MAEEFILCSDCFKDEGLRLDAWKLGIEAQEICANCSSLNGMKLTLELGLLLAHRFFVRGSLHKTLYGAAPLIQFNDRQKTSSVNFIGGLKEDITILEDKLNVRFFHYGPRFWMVGLNITPLEDLKSEAKRPIIINRILTEFPEKWFSEKDTFYKVRVNPQRPSEYGEYDSSPFNGKGRFDSPSLSILYASQDIEVCLHECRVAVEDELYIASLCPTKGLKLLDLTELIKENVTEFESLDIAIQMLFYAGMHSYVISRDIALSAYRAGFDGVIYPSYFSTLRTGAMPFETVYGISIRRLPHYSNYAKSQVVPNIALFGHPIREGKLTIKCLNKVVLNKVSYELSFGPTEFY